jgi:hypothetical protein
LFVLFCFADRHFLTVADTINIEWTFDNFYCDKVTANTKVAIELWEKDFFSDDFVQSITGETSYAVESEGAFKWSVPLVITDLLAKTGESESGAELYFYVYNIDNKGEDGKLPVFKITSMAAFISIEGIASTSYATGGLIEFDVLSKLLPSRSIVCNLLRQRFGQPLFPTDFGQIASFKTSGTPSVQKTHVTSIAVFLCVAFFLLRDSFDFASNRAAAQVMYRPPSTVSTGDGTYIVCKTNDGQQPSISTTLSNEKWFHIEQVCGCCVCCIVESLLRNDAANDLGKHHVHVDGTDIEIDAASRRYSSRYLASSK